MTITREAMLVDNNNVSTFVCDWAQQNKGSLIRGETPVDIEMRCLELCKTYIGGSWNNARSPADLTVRRISFAFTNQLYHVHLNDSVIRVANTIYPDEPSNVVVKLYREKYLKNFYVEDGERLNDLTVLTIMSQNDFGPKIYGIFADGFIQKYYTHEQYIAKHQKCSTLRRHLMILLARVNHLNVPISKESNLLFKQMRAMIQFAYANCHVNELTNEFSLKTLQQYNVLVEYEKLMIQIEKLNAPVVFCHNDFRGSNLLVTENERILVCDFEYCGYGTRGFDLACIAFEWGKDNLFVSNELVDESVLREMLQMYIEECDKLRPGYSQKPENSLEKHLKEVQMMMLANMLFLLSSSCVNKSRLYKR